MTHVPTCPPPPQGAAACYTNPFLSVESLTAAERKTPSRPVPLLDRSLKASRYLADFEELSQLGKGSFGAHPFL